MNTIKHRCVTLLYVRLSIQQDVGSVKNMVNVFYGIII